MSFGVAAADNDEVHIDAARRGERDGLLFPWFTQAFAEVDAATLAEAGDGFTGPGVEAIEEVHHASKNALVLAVGPVCDSAVGLG